MIEIDEGTWLPFIKHTDEIAKCINNVPLVKYVRITLPREIVHQL